MAEKEEENVDRKKKAQDREYSCLAPSIHFNLPRRCTTQTHVGLRTQEEVHHARRRFLPTTPLQAPQLHVPSTKKLLGNNSPASRVPSFAAFTFSLDVILLSSFISLSPHHIFAAACTALRAYGGVSAALNRMSNSMAGSAWRIKRLRAGIAAWFSSMKRAAS